jgi:hypothetical protein
VPVPDGLYGSGSPARIIDSAINRRQVGCFLPFPYKTRRNTILPKKNIFDFIIYLTALSDINI